MNWLELAALTNVLRFIYELIRDFRSSKKTSDTSDEDSAKGISGVTGGLSYFTGIYKFG